MPNYYLSVLYKHIIQVENKNLGLKVGGHKHTIAPPVKKVGGHMPPLPPRFLRQCILFTVIWKEGNVLFNDTLNTFYLRLYGRKEMFYLTTHSTHFIYGYMEGRKEMFYLTTHSTICFYCYKASDIW